ANLISMIGVLLAGVTSLLFIRLFDLKAGYALGLFAGSGTSTSTLQAAIATLGNDDPAIGYSVSYPFGVAGPILLRYLTFILLKPGVCPSPGTGLELLEIAVQRPEYFGKRLGELTADLPSDVRIVAVRRNNRNQPASPEISLAANDVLLVVGPSKEML